MPPLDTPTFEAMRRERCSFAFPGTYGHECGKPAVCVAVKKSDITKSGFYFARRCPECAKEKGGENSNAIRFEQLDQAKHVNAFK
jgi:hypothetical protein